MNKSIVPVLLKTRLLVGFLGEKAQFSWWQTAFFEPSSSLFLEPVFSKTFRLAQYHGVLEAARLIHDQHLSAGSYHLFRLPEELEQDLYTAFLATGRYLAASDAVSSKETALKTLASMAGSTSSATVGPTQIGSFSALDSLDTISEIGAAYVSAFKHGTHVFPYLKN